MLNIKNGSNLLTLTGIAILVVLVRAVIFPLDVTQKHNSFDVDRWLETSRNIVAGAGYSLSTYKISDEPQATAMRGPTVVYFFAAVIWLFGDNTWSIVIAQWLLEAGTSVIIFFIAIELFSDRRIAFLAALLYAFYLPGLIFTFRAWSEPLFTLLVAAFTLSLLRAIHQPSLRRFTLSGVLLGAATLARPILQFYPLIIFPLLWLTLGRRWLEAAWGSAVICVAFLLVLSPWVIRNYLVFNAVIPGSTHTGMPLYEGNYTLNQADYLRQRSADEANLALRQLLEERFGAAADHPDLGSYVKVKGIDERQVNTIASAEVLQVVLAYPKRYITLSIVRLFRLWLHHRFVNFLIFGGPLPNSWLVAAINGALLVLAVGSFVWFRGAWIQHAIIPLALLVYCSVLYAATLSIGRYSVPLMPYVMVFAAYTIVQLVWNSDRTRPFSALWKKTWL